MERDNLRFYTNAINAAHATIVRNYAQMFQQPIIIHDQSLELSRGSIFSPNWQDDSSTIRRQGRHFSFHHHQSVYRIYVIEVHATDRKLQLAGRITINRSG